MKRQLAFESLEGKLLQSIAIAAVMPVATVRVRFDKPINDPTVDPPPKPEPDPGPLPIDEPPILVPPLPPSGPVGPG
ncbi:hypothetical protein [Aquisphaera insulae]|uniref:hypothetical protein n=1 Tax=Aquisphaera insulae TaxID=2712864 RepID=UPI0013E9E1CB|nr:hypothetical protein [Aquisphaera insulae]